MEPPDQCQSAQQYSAIMVVHSATYHYWERQMFRAFYNNVTYTGDYRLKVIHVASVAVEYLLA